MKIQKKKKNSWGGGGGRVGSGVGEVGGSGRGWGRRVGGSGWM